MSADKANQSVPASECSTSSSSSEHENRCTIPPNLDQHAPAARSPDVFERNYQFSRIYERKRRALVTKLEANEVAQRCFKAQPLKIIEFRKVENAPMFTVPKTPEVMKRTSKRTANKGS